jgi:hypothetical protein
MDGVLFSSGRGLEQGSARLKGSAISDLPLHFRI